MTDTDRRTEPAMDAEDWDYFLSGGIRKHTLQDAVECAERGRRDLTPHALAALALYGERYGFTWADVDTCRYAAEHLHHYGLVMLADRLEALLPDRDALPPR